MNLCNVYESGIEEAMYTYILHLSLAINGAI